ncbi:MAG: cell division protein ZapE [Pseudomonadota bacterium]
MKESQVRQVANAEAVPGSAGPANSESPLEHYERLLAEGVLAPDPAQRLVIGALNDLYRTLTAPPPQLGLLKRLSVRFREPQPPPRGLYIWGSVGRVKTMLMDIFYDRLPPGVGVRMHFHRFMHRVQAELKALSGVSDPLAEVAKQFARDARVLCFDEFFVSDIGDAMILAEMLRHLFALGVTMVATSNVVPSGLYANGLQRRRFLPAIELLETYLEVLELGSPTDFRLRALKQAEIYHSPLDAAAEAGLERSFRSLAPEADWSPEPLEIEGRPIPVRALAPDVAWFEFAALCEGPRSQVDYIELSREFHTVLLANVPQLTARQENAARRFIALIDEFYDRGVKLIISAAVPILELYAGDKLRFEFERTQSRLIEMQSEAYLARDHQA